MFETWERDGTDWVYHLEDGSYALVSPDDEPTGHWFISVEYADETSDDDFRDSPHEAMMVAEQYLHFH